MDNTWIKGKLKISSLVGCAYPNNKMINNK